MSDVCTTLREFYRPSDLASAPSKLEMIVVTLLSLQHSTVGTQSREFESQPSYPAALRHGVSGSTSSFVNREDSI